MWWNDILGYVWQRHWLKDWRKWICALTDNIDMCVQLLSFLRKLCLNIFASTRRKLYEVFTLQGLSQETRLTKKLHEKTVSLLGIRWHIRMSIYYLSFCSCFLVGGTRCLRKNAGLSFDHRSLLSSEWIHKDQVNFWTYVTV